MITKESEVKELLQTSEIQLVINQSDIHLGSSCIILLNTTTERQKKKQPLKYGYEIYWNLSIQPEVGI